MMNAMQEQQFTSGSEQSAKNMLFKIEQWWTTHPKPLFSTRSLHQMVSGQAWA
jgi:hypothetical protein